MADLNLDLSSQTLDQRILSFKSDPEKIKDVNDFLNDLIEKARNDAETRRASMKQKTLISIPLQNGTKRIGAWSNRARGFMSRVITAISNCTNSVRNAAANRP